MSRLQTSLVEDAHGYTRSKVPWILSLGGTAYDKMINYISGGGMRTFGRTVRQEEVRRRQTRFLVVAALLASVWLLFFIF